MHTFPIQKETRRTAEKEVGAEGRKGELHRDEEISSRKEDAKEKFREQDERPLAEGERKEKVARSAAEQPQEEGAQEGGKGAHLNSPPILPFAP